MAWNFDAWCRNRGIPSDVIDEMEKRWLADGRKGKPGEYYTKAFVKGAIEEYRKMKEQGVDSEESLKKWREEQDRG